MLIKRKNSMTANSGDVKKTTRTALTILVMLTAAIAPAAFASNSQMTDNIVTVKLQMSELKTKDGAQKVYAKLKKTALSYCRADRATLKFLDQSVEDCTTDLMTQFVDSVDSDVLKRFHLAKQPVTSAKKFALNEKDFVIKLVCLSAAI